MKHLLLLLIFSCTITPQSGDEFTPPWGILESYSSEWETKQVSALLGKPDKVLTIRGKITWIYQSPSTGFQIWAIGVTDSQSISGITYFPRKPEKRLHITDVEKRWALKKCVHKKETALIAGHHEAEELSLICDGGKATVFYDRYNEVEAISVK